MPVIKNPISRFKAINECLRSRNKKYWSKEELIEAILEKTDIAIKERTLDNDIYFMRHNSQLKYNAPIEFSKSENGYYYEDPDYSIDNLPLNDNDIEALEFVTTILAQYRNVKIFNEFTGTVDKLISLVNHIKNTDHESEFAFIDFEKSSNSIGYEHLNSLIEAIKNKKVISLEYKKFLEPSKKHIISPYLLKEYRNRWYLLGYHHLNKRIKTYGLDRIISVSCNTQVDYQDIAGFNPDAYFKNTIGITFIDEAPQEIILAFKPLQGNYLKTQPLHNSQEILIDNETTFQIRIVVVPNYELYSTILSYGDDVNVLSPDCVRQRIKEIISKCFAYYQ